MSGLILVLGGERRGQSGVTNAGADAGSFRLYQEVLAYPRILCKRGTKAIVIFFILITNSPSWLPTFVLEYLVH